MAKLEGNLMGVKACRGSPSITHLFFVNDSIVFGEASEKGDRVMKDILDQYERASGKKVNFEKSVIFFSSNVEDNAANMIVSKLGVRGAYNIECYLGLPTLIGRKKEAFSTLCDRLRSKVNSWNNRFLSQGGKEVYIKTVLQALPAYSMSCFLLPKTLCYKLEQMMTRFWW